MMANFKSIQSAIAVISTMLISGVTSNLDWCLVISGFDYDGNKSLDFNGQWERGEDVVHNGKPLFDRWVNGGRQYLQYESATNAWYLHAAGWPWETHNCTDWDGKCAQSDLSLCVAGQWERDSDSTDNACNFISDALVNNANVSMCTNAPTMDPTSDPTTSPINPTAHPTLHPTLHPTSDPTTSPIDPTAHPTLHLTLHPTLEPTSLPTSNPTTSDPTLDPTANPTVNPTTLNPTASPIDLTDCNHFVLSYNNWNTNTSKYVNDCQIGFNSVPEMFVCKDGSDYGTVGYVIEKQKFNTSDIFCYFPQSHGKYGDEFDVLVWPVCDKATDCIAPTDDSTEAPTNNPSSNPTQSPTNAPTNIPTNDPTQSPTNAPSSSTLDTSAPTLHSTANVTLNPTGSPTISPTDSTAKYVTLAPTLHPTSSQVSAANGLMCPVSVIFIMANFVSLLWT